LTLDDGDDDDDDSMWTGIKRQIYNVWTDRYRSGEPGPYFSFYVTFCCLATFDFDIVSWSWIAQ